MAAEGEPGAPDELGRHSILIGPAGKQRDAWLFRSHGEAVTVRVDSRLSFSDSEGVTAAAVAGLGITSTGLWGCRAELAEGKLLRLLPDWDLGWVEVHALFAAGRATKASARAMVKHLEQELSRLDVS